MKVVQVFHLKAPVDVVLKHRKAHPLRDEVRRVEKVAVMELGPPLYHVRRSPTNRLGKPLPFFRCRAVLRRAGEQAFDALKHVDVGTTGVIQQVLRIPHVDVGAELLTGPLQLLGRIRRLAVIHALNFRPLGGCPPIIMEQRFKHRSRSIAVLEACFGDFASD